MLLLALYILPTVNYFFIVTDICLSFYQHWIMANENIFSVIVKFYGDYLNKTSQKLKVSVGIHVGVFVI